MKHIPTTWRKRAFSCLLALLLLVPTVFFPARTAVSASVETNISRLTEWQQDFLRVIRSLALKDSYDTGVLASVTAGQALYEGGWARYGISVIANNQFGIKAYSNWSGKVFDNKSYILYDSYDDLVRIKGSSYARSGSIWRAYDSWEDSVRDHSSLFYNESKYAAVLAAETYEDAAYEIVKAGYTSDYGYSETLIRVIEDYGLDRLDEVTADVNGVVGMVMDRSKAVLAAGESLQLRATAYPEPVLYTPSGEDSEVPEPVPFEVVWESNAPSVATVDANGKVTANGQGIALITATYNGKEAACLICVGTNAFVVDSDTAVRAEPDEEADTLGKIYRGMPVAVLGNCAYTADDGTQYYQVRGTASTGKLITGYVLAERIYLTTRQVSIINTKTELNLEVGVTYRAEVEIAPADAEDKTLTWATSDPSVATVDADGVISTHARGTATVTITAASGISLDITVHVGGTVTYEGVTTANLNVRVAPDKESESLGLIAEGTKVTLFGEPVDGWYYVEAQVISGKTVKGYSYATYIETESDQPSGDDPNNGGSTVNPDLPGTADVRERTGIVAVDEGSSLNIRTAPGTKGERLIRIDNGTPVVIVGEDILLEDETTYKVWYCVQLYLDDTFYEGYAAADFIEVTGENTSGSTGGLTVTDTAISGISPDTTVAQLCKMLGRQVTVSTADGTARGENEAVATGDEVQYTIGSVKRQKTLTVSGDVSGDGTVGLQDYMLVRLHVLGAIELEGAFLQAALVAGSETVGIQDYMLIRLHVLGAIAL